MGRGRRVHQLEVAHEGRRALGGDRRERSGPLPPNPGKSGAGNLGHILARSVRATRILEIGTLGGYSTIWLARARGPGGRLISLEIDARHREVAWGNVRRAGLADRVEIRLGRAIDSLKAMVAEKEPPFDFVFIGADKGSDPDSFDFAVRLSHPGSRIVVDNVVRGGAVADAHSQDPLVLGVRAMSDHVAREARVLATTIRTVGVTGYDGITLALVRAR